MAIRLALMFDHYRSDRMWSHDLLVRAEVTLSRLREALSRESVFSTQETITQILLALADDLNTPLVISLLENWIDQTLNGASGGDSDELKDCLDSLLGLKL
ncbi:unannotated protein [freshwater metagenome]|uniref:Unannotated protein n=1 Tax=freshwater metagenome TaxID=449393 RepID=A0A6J7ISS8_9ZZZZ